MLEIHIIIDNGLKNMDLNSTEVVRNGFFIMFLGELVGPRVSKSVGRDGVGPQSVAPQASRPKIFRPNLKLSSPELKILVLELKKTRCPPIRYGRNVWGARPGCLLKCHRQCCSPYKFPPRFRSPETAPFKGTLKRRRLSGP